MVFFDFRVLLEVISCFKDTSKYNGSEEWSLSIYQTLETFLWEIDYAAARFKKHDGWTCYLATGDAKGESSLDPYHGKSPRISQDVATFFLALEPAKTRNATVPKETDYTAWWMQQLIDDGSHFSKGMLLLD